MPGLHGGPGAADAVGREECAVDVRGEGGQVVDVIGLDDDRDLLAEGAKPIPGTLTLAPERHDEWGHVILGGIGNVVAAELERATAFDTRVTILGHVQRGGSPTAYDRVLSTRFGIGAIDAVHDGAFGTMVAMQGDRIVRVPLDDIAGRLKTVDPELFDEVVLPFFFG